jgi:hypothetical protein
MIAVKGLKLDAKSTVLGAGAGLLAGGVAGYLLCRRLLLADLDRRLTEEVNKAKSHYNDRAKAFLESGSSYVGRPVPTTVAGESDNGDDGEPTVGESASTEAEVKPADVTTAQDPFEGLPTEEELAEQADLDERNLFVEAKKRTYGKPRRISLAEFSETPPGTQNITITYYGGDKVLVDEKDQPIRDHHKIVGALTPLSFGGISGDPHICYVRNEELEVDFEVVLDARSYAEAILNYGRPNRGK